MLAHLLQPAFGLKTRCRRQSPWPRPLPFDRRISIRQPLDVGTHSQFEVRVFRRVRSRTPSGQIVGGKIAGVEVPAIGIVALGLVPFGGATYSRLEPNYKPMSPLSRLTSETALWRPAFGIC
jgi:hypothetical protein